MKTLYRRVYMMGLLMFIIISNAQSVLGQCHPNDVEEPTVICRDLHTTFMPDTCMVVIWAKDLIASASDDKTHYDWLKITFDQAGKENSKILTGDGGLEQIVDIWVTDECGKQTLCRPTVHINDNDMDCVRAKFDLALIKTVSNSTPGPFELGGNVTFDIEVINQGTEDAFEIEITDYIPEGLILNDSEWTQSGDIAIKNDNISFLEGFNNSTTVQIDFTIDPDFRGATIVNLAEISGADNDEDPNNEPPVDDDSTPDNEDENDGEPIDDAVSDPNDEDDHDPAEIEIDRYDLALDKEIVTEGPYELGDVVTFTIKVTNEGTIDASNVGVTDFPDDNLTYVSTNAGSIANVNGSGTAYTILDLDSGAEQEFTITFSINRDFTGAQLMNIVEITEDDGNDVDSDPDVRKDTDDGKDGTNPGDDDGGNIGQNDDDDEDMVVIPVDRYDLAITKDIVTEGPYQLGDDVTFQITVTNEGSLDATNIGVTDFPDGAFTFVSTNAGTIANVSGTGTNYTILDLDSGESQEFTITFNINDSFTGDQLMNIVEITEDDGDDVDSDPDSRKDEDDGLDDPDFDPNNPAIDDDEDMVLIRLDDYDLAIDKEIITSGPYELGDEVTFRVTVANEGSLDAANIIVTDFPDSDLIFVRTNAGSVANVTGTGTSYTILDLDSGAEQEFTITFRIDEDFTGDQLMNIVEITEDDGDDIDSDPDIRKDTDDGRDDTSPGDDDGGNVGQTDDDDEDMVMIPVDRYDLAIDKSILTSGPFEDGDLVTFQVTVSNQGSLDAANVGITDFPDADLEYVSTNVGGIANVTGSGTNYTILDLDSGENQSFTITFKINSNTAGDQLMNIVEITEDDGDDIDSDPDTRKDEDDGLDGTSDNNDDDEDMVTIIIDRYDLSIQKSIVNPASIYELDDLVTFSVAVTNEGSLDASNVEVADFPDADLLYSSDNSNTNSNVTGSGSSLVYNVISLPSGQTETFEITFRIDNDFTGNQLMNIVEITEDDGDDVDSDPDSRKADDDGLDATVTGDDDGGNVGENDDDDEDMVMIPVGQVYDLAIDKEIVTQGPYEIGDNVTFSVTVTNEGNQDAANIGVTDFPDAGLVFVSSNVGSNTNVSGNNNDYTIASLLIGESEVFEITFQIDEDFTGTQLMNIVEITEDDGDDVDSDPDIRKDTDDGRDGTATGDDDGGNVGQTDDDDEDMVMITIDRYDLAIDKLIVTTGPYELGDNVTFRITVTNEGSLDAANVGITDFPDTDLAFVSTNAGSIANVTGTANNYTILDLDAGNSQAFDITYVIDVDFTGDQLMNIVEITEDDGNDVDSDPDIRKNTDDGKDGTVTGDDDGGNAGQTDDDDEDMVMIDIDRYDLAIDKETISQGPFSPGDNVTFRWIIENQGSLDAANVEVTDIPQTGLSFVSDNSGSNSNISRTGLVYIVASLPSGAKDSIDITMLIDESFEGDQLMNIVEITGDDGDDVDSDPDVDKETDDGRDGTADGEDDDEDMVTIQISLCVCPDEDFIGQAVVTCAGGAFSNEAVAAILDFRNANTAPLGDNWADPLTNGASTLVIDKPVTWTIEEMGQIFGTSVGNTNGDIYFAATNVYSYDGDPFTPTGIGPGGESGLYKTNFSNPAVLETLVTTSNTFMSNPVGGTIVPGKFLNTTLANNPLPTGWGNIAYDELSNTLYGSNLSDGRIYAINASSGVIEQVIDPFPAGGDGFLSNPFPADQVVWAIELNECTRQLFFIQQNVSGGGEALGDAGGNRDKTLYTLDLSDSGVMSNLSLFQVLNMGTREKITDIDFNATCDRMILAERGTVHNSMTLLYVLSGGVWNLITDISVGNIAGGDPWKNGLNSAGGVAFGADQVSPNGAMCDTIIWTMADCLDPSLVPGECNVYGPQGSYIPPSNFGSLSGNLNGSAIFVDITPEFNFDPRFQKFGLGDIEIFNCCCPVTSTGASALETVEIGGKVIGPGGVGSSDFNVSLDGAEIGYDITDNNGEYSFDDLDMHLSYSVTPERVDDMINGVTTLDLIIIQNHVLGISEINNPKMLVSADINNSGSIDALDLIELRKIILGKTYASPSSEAWRFITALSDMEMVSSDLYYNEVYQYQDLDQDEMNADFYAIKIGDVNNTLGAASSRSKAFESIYIDRSLNSADFIASDEMMLSGLQMSIDIDDQKISHITSDIFYLSTANYHVEGNVLKISFNANNESQVFANESLFTIEFENSTPIIELTSDLSAEFYNNRKESIPFVLIEENSIEGYTLDQNNPNPSVGITSIDFVIPTSQVVQMQFYSLDGRLVGNVKQEYPAGRNTIIVDQSMIESSTGSIIYKMITEEFVATKNMIILR